MLSFHTSLPSLPPLFRVNSFAKRSKTWWSMYNSNLCKVHLAYNCHPEQETILPAPPDSLCPPLLPKGNHCPDCWHHRLKACLFLNFKLMESYSTYSYVSGFFHSTLCLWDSHTLLQVTGVHSFSLFHTRPLSTLLHLIYPFPAKGSLGSFKFVTVTNSSTINILVHDFWWFINKFLLDTYLGSGFLG